MNARLSTLVVILALLLDGYVIHWAIGNIGSNLATVGPIWTKEFRSVPSRSETRVAAADRP